MIQLNRLVGLLLIGACCLAAAAGTDGPPADPLDFYRTTVKPALRAYEAAPTAEQREACQSLVDRLLLARPDSCFFRQSHFFGGGLSYGPNDKWGGPLLTRGSLALDAGDPRAAFESRARYYQLDRREMTQRAAHGLDLYQSPATTERLALQQLVAEGWIERISPRELVACGGDFVFSRWTGGNLDDALISLRDVAFSLGNDPASNQWDLWMRAWRVDWPAGRFTLLAGGRELTFARDSAEALLDGQPKPLRRACEQVYYDLYVPLADLTELLGGTLRRPREGELTAYTENLPVGIWILELPGLTAPDG